MINIIIKIEPETKPYELERIKQFVIEVQQIIKGDDKDTQQDINAEITLLEKVNLRLTRMLAGRYLHDVMTEGWTEADVEYMRCLMQGKIWKEHSSELPKNWHLVDSAYGKYQYDLALIAKMLPDDQKEEE